MPTIFTKKKGGMKYLLILALFWGLLVACNDTKKPKP